MDDITVDEVTGKFEEMQLAFKNLPLQVSITPPIRKSKEVYIMPTFKFFYNSIW